MTSASTVPDAPPLHQAVRLYGQWRVGDGDYSMKTWAGEAPGLLAFADYCHDLGVDHFWMLNDDLASDWWAHVKADHGDATAVTRLHQLRSFLRYCVRKKWLAEDPTTFLRATRPAAELRERLSAGELLLLVEAADFPQHRLILALASNLALRQAEMKRLLLRDVNLDAGSIRVRITKTHETPPDDMPITAELDSELRRWLAHYRASCPGLTPASHLVPSQHIEPKHGRVTYRPDRSVGEPEEVVKRALAKLGWEDVKGEGIHTIRRSLARIFFDAAEAEESFNDALLGTMRLLHHDRAETTLRYIGVDRQTLARDKFLRGRPFLTQLAGAPALRVVGQ
jgi:integrase